MTDITFRRETADDYKGIREVNDLAFGQTQEGKLIDKLRIKAGFINELSIIALFGSKIVGHILFFPVSVVFGEKRYQTLSLGPMAVLPGYQKQGIGGELIRRGLKKAEKLGFKSVVVLGHPEYYPRFGFRKSADWNIRDPFGAPEEAMMAIELEKRSLEFGGGIIEYPEEFYSAV